MYLLLYFMKEVLVIGKFEWKNEEPITHKIRNLMRNLGGLDDQDEALATFFGMF
jgi:hypothetical protein